MGLVDKARMLESRIARALHKAAADVVGADGREPLAIVLAIVEEIERQAQPGSRGTRVFPFNHAAVTVLAPSRESRLRFEALFAATPSLSERVLDRLRRIGCDAGDLRIDIEYAARPARHWGDPAFDVSFDRIAIGPEAVAPPETKMPAIELAVVRGTAERRSYSLALRRIDIEYAARPARHWRDPAFDVSFDRIAIGPEAIAPPETKMPAIELAVVRGTAERRSYSLALRRIDIGRGSEVRDGRHRLLRSNHVVFVEGAAGINETVSRCHAHLAVDAVSAVVRIYDDGSAHGTGIVRGGRTIPVPPGSRGVRVRGGDEVVLGEARLRVRLDDRRG